MGARVILHFFLWLCVASLTGLHWSFSVVIVSCGPQIWGTSSVLLPGFKHLALFLEHHSWIGESKARLVGVFIYDCSSHCCMWAEWLACVVCEQHSELRHGSYHILRQRGPTACKNHPGDKGQNWALHTWATEGQIFCTLFLANWLMEAARQSLWSSDSGISFWVDQSGGWRGSNPSRLSLEVEAKYGSSNLPFPMSHYSLAAFRVCSCFPVWEMESPVWSLWNQKHFRNYRLWMFYAGQPPLWIFFFLSMKKCLGMRLPSWQLYVVTRRISGHRFEARIHNSFWLS